MSPFVSLVYLFPHNWRSLRVSGFQRSSWRWPRGIVWRRGFSTPPSPRWVARPSRLGSGNAVSVWDQIGNTLCECWTLLTEILYVALLHRTTGEKGWLPSLKREKLTSKISKRRRVETLDCCWINDFRWFSSCCQLDAEKRDALLRFSTWLTNQRARPDMLTETCNTPLLQKHTRSHFSHTHTPLFSHVRIHSHTLTYTLSRANSCDQHCSLCLLSSWVHHVFDTFSSKERFCLWSVYWIKFRLCYQNCLDWSLCSRCDDTHFLTDTDSIFPHLNRPKTQTPNNRFFLRVKKTIIVFPSPDLSSVEFIITCNYQR